MLCDELLEVGMKVSEATYHAALEKLGERQTFEVRQMFGGEQDDGPIFGGTGNDNLIVKEWFDESWLSFNVS